jgi:hypothetical protein
MPRRSRPMAIGYRSSWSRHSGISSRAGFWSTGSLACGAATDLSCPDPIAAESPMLAGISSASIQGRIALGPRAGRRVWRVG